MNREDLKNYKYVQIWIKDQTEYIETQKETVNKLSSILSDMPKGSRMVYDNEAEKIAELVDGEEAFIQAICVSAVTVIRKKKNMIVYKMAIRDDTGTLVTTWYNQSYIKDKFRIGEGYNFYGKISKKYGD